MAIKTASTVTAPLLSIAIPTYKRPELLRRCLISVIASASPFSVPIYVYDDSLTDINDQVLNELCHAYGQLFVVKNSVNLGIDENIAKCVEHTPSTYVWLLGEDDLMKKEAVAAVIDKLAPPLDFIFVNYSYVSNDYAIVLRERRLEIDEVVAPSGQYFFENYLWAAGFIGACIISRAAWQAVDRKKYYGTFFTHVGVISEIIARGKMLMFGHSYILNRAEDTSSTSWQSYALDVNFGWDKMLFAASQFFDPKSLEISRKSAQAVFWHRSIIFLVSKRADGVYGLPEWRKNILGNGFGFIFRAMAALVAVAPQTPLFFVKRTLAGRAKQMLMLLLKR